MPFAIVDTFRLIGRTSEGDRSETIVMERTSSCDVDSVELSRESNLVALGAELLVDDPPYGRDMMTEAPLRSSQERAEIVVMKKERLVRVPVCCTLNGEFRFESQTNTPF